MNENFFENQAYNLKKGALDDALLKGDITKEKYLADSKQLDIKYEKQLRFKDNGKAN